MLISITYLYREEERLRWMRENDARREREEMESEKRKEERVALSRVIMETQKGLFGIICVILY